MTEAQNPVQIQGEVLITLLRSPNLTGLPRFLSASFLPSPHLANETIVSIRSHSLNLHKF